MYSDSIRNLKEQFEKKLPGKDAQLRMAPSFRLDSNNSVVRYKAGVMLLLYPVNEKLTTVFMKRSDYPGIHSGQISFPGGKFHVDDKDLLKTALRETREEFGIAEDTIEVMGGLTPLFIPASGFEVYPFVGFINHVPQFKTDPSEVNYLIETEIDYLLSPKVKKTEFQQFGLMKGSVPYFEVNQHKIWGATAMILNEFIELYKG